MQTNPVSNHKIRIVAVAIGRNEGERLARCITSIRAANQTTEIEISAIFYVDSNSSDGSPERARQAGAQVILLQDGQMTAARGRNTGWRAAQSLNPDYILFLDGDTILHPDFPVRAWEYLNQNPQIAAVFGQRRETGENQSLYTRVLNLDWICLPGAHTFFGGDVLIRFRALQQTGGFDDTLIAGEEPDLCRRLRELGWQIEHLSIPMTGHDLAIYRFSQYWRRLLRAGYAFAQVSARFRSTGDPFWSAESRRNRLRGIFWATSLLLVLLAALGAALLPANRLGPFATHRALAATLPPFLWLAFLFVLALRTALRYRWKSDSALTLALYGLHSHLQQIPVALGQLFWWLDHRADRSRGLMEYKDIP